MNISKIIDISDFNSSHLEKKGAYLIVLLGGFNLTIFVVHSV